MVHSASHTHTHTEALDTLGVVPAPRPWVGQVLCKGQVVGLEVHTEEAAAGAPPWAFLG